MITPPASSAERPAWLPCVIAKTRGSPRGRRPRGSGAGGAGGSSSWAWPSGAGTVRPNRSLRITETAERMKSQSRARNSTLRTVRAISDMDRSASGGCVDEHPIGADLNTRSLSQRRTLYLVSVDRDSVGATDVDDVDVLALRGLGAPDLGMQPGDAGIADPQVSLRAAPDGQPRGLQWMSGAIDFEHKLPRTSARSGRSFGRVVRLDPGHRLGDNREPAGRELAVELEIDFDRAVENVAE